MDRIRHARLRANRLTLYLSINKKQNKRETITMSELISFTSALIIAVSLIDLLLAIFINVLKEVRYKKATTRTV